MAKFYCEDDVRVTRIIAFASLFVFKCNFLKFSSFRFFCLCTLSVTSPFCACKSRLIVLFIYKKKIVTCQYII